jgi:CarD family transcriptional regulator
MTILIPVTDQTPSSIRPLSSSEKIKTVFDFLSQPAKKVPAPEYCTNWKQRNKEYQTKLRKGDLRDISEIYRELKWIEQFKELSFCEKSLLQQTEMLLAEEIALVTKLAEEKTVEQLRSYFHPVLHNTAVGFSKDTINGA